MISSGFFFTVRDCFFTLAAALCVFYKSLFYTGRTQFCLFFMNIIKILADYDRFVYTIDIKD